MNAQAARAPRRIRPHTYLAYGITDLFGSGAMAVIGGWILFFYTSFCGLSAVEATSIFAIARILDAVGGTFIGHVSDTIGNSRLARRFGRRRMFLLFSLPLMPSFALMWVSGQSYLYYLATYVFFEVVYAAVLIPYETLAAEMSDDYRTRARFAGARILTGQAAVFLASMLPRLITGGTKDATADTFLLMGGIFTLIFIGAILTTYLFTWEREPNESDTAAPLPAPFGPMQIFRNIALTLRIRAFRLHLGMYLGGFTANDVLIAVLSYYVVFVLGGNVATASTVLGVMTATQFVSAAAFVHLTVRLHPGPAFRLAASFYAVGIVLMAALALPGFPAPLWWIYPIAMCAGIGRGGLVYIPWNTYNYVADVDEIVSTQRREGIFAGVMTMVRKAVGAFAVMLVGLLLEAGGFQSSAPTQPHGAQLAIIAGLTLFPLLALAFGMRIARRFRLNEHTHSVLMAEIARFRAGDRRPPTGEAAAIVRDLTGQPPEKLWAGRLDMPRAAPGHPDGAAIAG
ncbi:MULTISPECIES: MFS transporter [unclassified Sphingomonas]|uniref:MFS transporter n=1 Tax=unclassified Sphingomonas TaxID=196159 RepID=UPI0020162223|nr:MULTISPECIES: MFS transporter [unclassified Sphingomonas]